MDNSHYWKNYLNPGDFPQEDLLNSSEEQSQFVPGQESSLGFMLNTSGAHFMHADVNTEMISTQQGQQGQQEDETPRAGNAGSISSRNISQLANLSVNTEMIPTQQDQQGDVTTRAGNAGVSPRKITSLPTVDCPTVSTTSSNTAWKIKMIEDLLRSASAESVSLFYSRHGHLEDRHRNIITRDVVDHFVLKGETMNADMFLFFSSEIKRLYPTETMETYYIPAQNGRKPMGKLYKRYENKRYDYKKREKKEKAEEDLQREMKRTKPDNTVLRKWLQDNSSPWNMVLEKWQEMFPERMEELSNAIKTPQQPSKKKNKKKSLIFYSVDPIKIFLEKWPRYLDPKGYELILLDFSLKFPDAKCNFDFKFNELLKKLLPIFHIQVKDSLSKEYLKVLEGGNLDDDSRDCITMLLMHAILKPGRQVGSKALPSVTTAQMDFAQFVGASNNLELEVTNLQKEYAMSQKKIQPKIFIVGFSDPEVFKVETCYVYFNGFKYQLKFRTCIQVILEMCVLFDLKYSELSEFLWIFIQEYFYGFKWKPIPKVRTLIQDLLNNGP
ncbi:hypothetical protein DMENIID0001_126800 [Sergentomyia squamirostris]